MDLSGAGTAVMLALAAVLWFLYLLPTWVRRREFLATERNATRLQRAMRVMAETAEVPDEVRTEISAREAAHREKLLHQQQRQADALARVEVRAAAARARAAEAQAVAVERVSRASGPVGAEERLRRARRASGILLLAALLLGGVQLWLMATTGVVLGSWLVIGVAVAMAAVSVRLQQGIVARREALALRAQAPAARRAPVLIDADAHPIPTREWTPVSVPKPLYLERNEAPRVPIQPPAAADELLRAAAAEAERALQAAHAEPEVVRFPARTAAPAAPSRFASMGVVGELEGTLPDLDEVLRRRRSG